MNEEDIDDNEYDYMFRFIIVGDIAVGKSCLLLQFSANEFKAVHEITIGVEFSVKTMDIDNHSVKVQIWDTAGEEAFQSITRSYYKGAIGALLVYDITRKDTFNHCKKWLNEVKDNARKDICIILVGNKNDLSDKREVSYEEGEMFAQENELLFIETSAKTAENVEECFIKTIKEIIKNIGPIIANKEKVRILFCINYLIV